MQNLTTTLYSDIKNKSKIILPAGQAKFNWIDVSDVGEVAAIVINNFELYKNQKIELTSNQNLNFYEVVEIINNQTGSKIKYQNLDPLRFIIFKLRQNYNFRMITVILLLHFLSRFQPAPTMSDNFKNITHKNPSTLEDFVTKNTDKFN
jgi:uncharacterized protein YbjT (DUF2867 family)